MKRVAIYNRFLKTAGGGEKHMGAIAEYLSIKKGYQVDIISHDKIDMNWLCKRLSINLSKCTLVLEPTRNDHEIERLSAAYDIFINCTHGSRLQPKASYNAILIYFPFLYRFYQLRANPYFHNFFKNTINSLSQGSIQILEGAYSMELLKEKRGFWTSKKFTFTVLGNKLPSLHLVIKAMPVVNIGSLQSLLEKIVINGISTAFQVEDERLFLKISAPKIVNKIEIFLSQTIQLEDDSRPLSMFVYGIGLDKAFHSWFDRFSFKRANYFYSLQGHIDFIEYLNVYDVVWSNSNYTKRWLKRIWGKDSTILYPMIPVEDFKPAKDKKKVILSVGRFFAGGHNKKHIPMIRTFQKMCNEGLKEWEFHLCGGAHKESEDIAYIQEVKSLIVGYPIFLHFDIPFPKLQQQYAEATIFWHAAGFGESERKNPDKFEHFGITTVEAMAAGCIPIVINKAGQKEIVNNEVNGFLWNSLRELKQITYKVINLNIGAQERIKKEAIKKASHYGQRLLERTLEASLDI